MSATVSMDSETGLKAFLAPLAPEDAVRLRTLAHAWSASGGHLQVGKVTIRLLANDAKGRPFTGATLHADQAGSGPVVEIARVILQQHGLTATTWASWCDEHADLRGHGLQADAKYPAVRLRALSGLAVARLGVGLRDLRMAL